MKRLALMALCLPLLAPAAAPLEDACVGAPEPSAVVDPDFLHLRRDNPDLAWAFACAHRNEPLIGPLRVAEAMVRRQATLSRALLYELESQPLPPLLRGRLLLARADLLIGLQEVAPAEPLLMAALAAMGSANDGAAALVRQRLANVAWRLGGDLDRSDAWLDEAERLLASAGRSDSLIQINVDDGRSYIAQSRDDMPAALRWTEVQAARLTRMGLADSPEMLLVLGNVGAILAQLGRLDEALATAERGAALMERHPEAPADYKRLIEADFSGILLRMGRPAEALPHADRSLALMREAWGGGSKVLVTLSGRAEVLMALRRWGEARRDFEEAQAIGSSLGASIGPVRWLRLEANHAQVLVQLDEKEAARALIDSGLSRLQTAAPGLSFWRGRLLRQRAALAARAGDWRAADADLAAAQAAQATLAGTDELLPLEAGRCVAQRQGGLAGDSCERLRDRLPEAPRLPAYLRFLLFNALGQAEAGEAALRWHLRALAAAEDVAGPDPRWSALDALARHWRGEGQRSLAVLAGKQAVLQVEVMRADLGADAQRLERGFLSDKLGVYHRLADWLAEDGRVAEALQVLRLLQREEFHGFVQRDARLAPRGPVVTDDLLSAREDRFWRDWTRHVPGDAGQAQAQEQRVQSWLDALSREMSPMPPAALPPPVARRPPVGTLAVSLFAGEHQLHLIFSDHQGQRMQSLPLAADDLARRVGQLLLELGRRAPAERLAPMLKQWHAELAVPLLAQARRAGATRLQLELFGSLRYLPLAALDAGQGPLGAQLSVVQQVGDEPLPSVARPSALRVQVLAVTQSLAGLPELPALAREVCHIVRGPVEGGPRCADGALPGQAWLNERFTRERFDLAARGGGNLLHVGTHFMLRPGHMGRSWLLLGNGERFTLDELAGLDFSHQALVTLSACETGLGGAELQGSTAGQEVAGLNRLIIRRGAAAVLASLWRVDDASTSVLMAAFYRGLARGLAPAVALQQAQARLRADPRWIHPYHWAGFYLAQRS